MQTTLRIDPDKFSIPRTRPSLWLLALAFLPMSPEAGQAEIPENFRRENLVTWCVTTFDAKERSPQERAAMLKRLGLRRVAYEWREDQVAEFETEFQAYHDNQIELMAFWRGHPAAEAIFKRLDWKPQIWVPLQSGKGLSNEEKIQDAAQALLPIAEHTKSLGFTLGLYNQGGWGGLPDNLVAVCAALKKQGHEHVGIVYNFHHAHPRIHTFADDLDRMLPHLLCVTLNGMADPVKYDISKKEHRTKPIGSGDHEAAMIAALVSKGYRGAVAILGHVANRDAEEVLKENLEGLEAILSAQGR